MLEDMQRSEMATEATAVPLHRESAPLHRRFTVDPFRPWDTWSITPAWDQPGVDLRDMAVQAAAAGPAWTGRWDGRVIGCAGFALLWPGRAQAWCLLDIEVPRRAWLGIHRAVRERLAQAPSLGVWRIEADAAFGFTEASRWLDMLGFEREGIARRFGPDGSDFIRFARVA